MARRGGGQEAKRGRRKAGSLVAKKPAIKGAQSLAKRHGLLQ